MMFSSLRQDIIFSALLSMQSAMSTVNPASLSQAFRIRGMTVRGSSIRKRLPLPSLLSTCTRPPMRSVRFFTMDIPSPVPSILLMVELWARSKGRKIRLRNSSLMPMPLS